MAFNIQFHPEAELELAESVGWYEEQRNGLGFTFFEDYLSIRNQLFENPAIYATVFGNVRRANFKKFPYSVFFEVEGAEVFIYAIFHQKRNPKSWSTRLE